jgi:hypothetical protein
MSGDEPQDNLSPESTAETGMKDAPIPMPSSVREEVIDLLAKILVADYQLFHGAPSHKQGQSKPMKGGSDGEDTAA